VKIHTARFLCVTLLAAASSSYGNLLPSSHADGGRSALSGQATELHRVDPRISAGPVRNVARLYSVSTSGGTGREYWTIPQQEAGVYAAFFTANFRPQGSHTSPKTFGCSLARNGRLQAQGTALDISTTGTWWVGVAGGNTISVRSGDVLTINCGLVEEQDWTWGDRPLEVTLTRLDGIVRRDLNPFPPLTPGVQGAEACCGGRQPKANIANVYTVTTGGSSDGKEYAIQVPEDATYAVSLTANFAPQGSPRAPVDFFCSIETEGEKLTISSTQSVSSSGFYAGVNGSNTASLFEEQLLVVSCFAGRGDQELSWTWGTRPLQLTLTRLDGMVDHPGQQAGPAHIDGAAPAADPIRNIAYHYSPGETGVNDGLVQFRISPRPDPGVFAASFTASFHGQGADKYAQYVCWMEKAGVQRGEASTTRIANIYWEGLNGYTIVKLNPGDGDDLVVWCGTTASEDWVFYPVVLQVSLVRLDGLVTGELAAARPARSGAQSVSETRLPPRSGA
jgi:hypothetical protein